MFGQNYIFKEFPKTKPTANMLKHERICTMMGFANSEHAYCTYVPLSDQ